MDADDPYKPPQSDVEPPIQIIPAPAEPPARDDRERYAFGLAAVGVVIFVQMVWRAQWKWGEAFLGAVCLLIGLARLWRLWRGRKRNP